MQLPSLIHLVTTLTPKDDFASALPVTPPVPTTGFRLTLAPPIETTPNQIDNQQPESGDSPLTALLQTAAVRMHARPNSGFLVAAHEQGLIVTTIAPATPHFSLPCGDTTLYIDDDAERVFHLLVLARRHAMNDQSRSLNELLHLRGRRDELADRRDVVEWRNNSPDNQDPRIWISLEDWLAEEGYDTAILRSDVREMLKTLDAVPDQTEVTFQIQQQDSRERVTGLFRGVVEIPGRGIGVMILLPRKTKTQKSEASFIPLRHLVANSFRALPTGLTPKRFQHLKTVYEGFITLRELGSGETTQEKSDIARAWGDFFKVNYNISSELFALKKAFTKTDRVLKSYPKKTARSFADMTKSDDAGCDDFVFRLALLRFIREVGDSFHLVTVNDITETVDEILSDLRAVTGLPAGEDLYTAETLLALVLGGVVSLDGE